MTLVRRGILLAITWVGLLMLAVYGFWSRHLAQQEIWQAPGGERFLIFLGITGTWFVAWTLFRPRWTIPATWIAIGIYTAAAVGILPLATVLFLLLACYVLGRMILPREDDLIGLLVGLSILMWLTGLLAHLPVNYPATYLVILAAAILVRPSITRQCLERASLLFRPREFAPVMLAVAAVPLLAHWLVVLKPEVSADALSMHLVVPAYVANHHLWSFDFQRFTWAVMPMGAVWSYTVAYLLGGEFAARLLNFALLVVLCAMVYRGARHWVGRSTALLAVALFAATPVVQLVTGSLFVETFYALLILGGITALWNYQEYRQPATLGASAFLLASAMSVKLMALPFVAVASIILLWLLWRDRLARWAGICAGLMILIAPAPYLYAWWKTGNPVFPYVNSVFRSTFFAAVMSPDPRFSEPLSWRTPFDVTFATHRFWEGQDGSAGFHFLLLAPLLFLVIRREWRFQEWTLVVSAYGATLLGFGLRPNVRYLYPAFPLLTLALAPLFREAAKLGIWFRRTAWATGLTCLAMNLWFLPSSSWHHKTFCLNPLDRNASTEYVEATAPTRLLVDRLNRDYPGEATLFLETMDVARLRGDTYSNGWHSYLFMQKVAALRTPLEALAMVRELGIRHFIYPGPAAGVPVREAQLATLISDFARTEGDAGRFRLATLKPEFLGPDGLERARLAERPPDPVPPGAYDDFDPRIHFVAHWSHDPQFEAPAHHSITYSDIPTAAFWFTFRGSAITWMYTKALNRGIAEVLIDGTSRGEVDLYSRDAAWQSTSVFDGLGAGDHRFEVRITSRKNPQSAGMYVDLDELLVK